MMPSPDELTCQELVELVTDYLEGALAVRDRERFEAHLLDCDECPIYLEQIRMTIRTVGTLTEQRMSQSAKDDLLRRFSTWKRDCAEPSP
jgi:anti-sigma factor RsiW